jgi:hypothetical protein
MKRAMVVVMSLVIVLTATVALAGAKDKVILVMNEECCTSGRAMYVKNKGDLPIKAIVRIDTAWPGPVSTKYEKFVVEPGEEVYVGCTQRSYPGSCYFARYQDVFYKITGAYYLK